MASMQETLKSFGAAQWGGGAPSTQIQEHDIDGTQSKHFMNMLLCAAVAVLKNTSVSGFMCFFEK